MSLRCASSRAAALRARIGAVASVCRGAFGGGAFLAGGVAGPTGLQAAGAVVLDDSAAGWAAEDARVLLRAAPRLADGAMAPTFTGMGERVGSYADWVYGWLSSLLTAWDLAATATVEAQREIWDGKLPDTGVVYDRLADEVQQRFDETVVQPDRTAAALADAWRRTMARVAALDGALAAERRARIERTAALLGDDPATALRSFGGPLLSAALTETAGPDLSFAALSEIEEEAGGTTDRVLVRSLRPLATRAMSVTTRVLLAPVAGGLMASPGAGGEGLLTAAATLLAVSAGIWGVDYAANRLDSALTQDAFEDGLRQLIRVAHSRASRIARRQAEAAVCAALKDCVPG